MLYQLYKKITILGIYIPINLFLKRYLIVNICLEIKNLIKNYLCEPYVQCLQNLNSVHYIRIVVQGGRLVGILIVEYVIMPIRKEIIDMTGPVYGVNEI